MTLRRLARFLLAATGAAPSRLLGPDYLHQQVERSWAKESRNLEWFGLRDGMSILDLGCGPGHFTQRLANRLPAARITALDAREDMVRRARERLGRRASVVRANAEATGLPDESFDFVLARLLLQHARDPLLVAREAHRLLVPGGKFVITDVDDELFGIVEPRVPGLRRVLARYGRAQAARGGNRRIGRMLVRLLRASGFADREIESVAIHSDEAGIEACFPQLDPVPLRSLLAEGHLSQLEHSALRAARKRFDGEQDAFALVLTFMVCGTKRGTEAVPA
jgi:ubiquinone/menaquinone biosynthesis C-methylase UbiE